MLKYKCNGVYPSLLPFIKFYYQGDHTHPVRRTVLVIEELDNAYLGYEFREGNIVRDIDGAKNSIKVYYKNLIPKWGSYCRFKMSQANKDKPSHASTLQKFYAKEIVMSDM